MPKGFGYGRFRKEVATTRAALRQILDDSCSAKGKKEMRSVIQVGEGTVIELGDWVLIDAR